MRTAFRRVTIAAMSLRAASTAAATAASGIPPAAVQLANATQLVWASLNSLERQRWESLSDSSTGKVDFNQIRHQIAAGTVKAAPFSGKLAAAVAKAKTIQDVANVVEAALTPVRVLEKERYDLQLHIWGLTDSIYLGLAASTPAQIDTYKKDLAKSKDLLAANRKKHSDYCAATFDTDVFNQVINVFRIAGESDHFAIEYASTLLDDMTLCGLKFDECTQLLLKSVVFGDQPHEDSNLLFSFVENPERGEISAAKAGDLAAIADAAMKTLSERHTTPLTDGKLLRQTDTHPMLQRSPE